MKHISFLIALASLMLLSFGLAHGVTEVVLDNDVPVTGYLGGDSVYADSAVRFNFRFRFTDTPGDTILNSFTNGFRVWTYANGVTNYTDNFSAITYDTFPWGWEDLYDLIFSIQAFSTDGVGADTVGFGGSLFFGPGVLNGTDSLCWYIETTPTTDGDTLCIDSAFYPPGGEWLWVKEDTIVGETKTFVPNWGGPYCFHVSGGGAADDLLVDSLSLTFEVEEGTGADTSTIRITSSGGAAKAELDFQITADETWLTFKEAAGGVAPDDTLDGNTPMDVWVIADYTGLVPGVYSATITITSSTAGNTPIDIPTNMSVSTEVLTDGTDLPTSYALSQNYPNPFNPSTEIKFDIPIRSHVTLTVFNVLGQRVATLVDKEMSPGRYLADWNSTSDNGTEVTSGVYFYKLEAGDFIQTKKMLLLK
jgi:hypothetical protein